MDADYDYQVKYLSVIHVELRLPSVCQYESIHNYSLFMRKSFTIVLIGKLAHHDYCQSSVQIVNVYLNYAKNKL